MGRDEKTDIFDSTGWKYGYLRWDGLEGQLSPMGWFGRVNISSGTGWNNRHIRWVPVDWVLEPLLSPTQYSGNIPDKTRC